MLNQHKSLFKPESLILFLMLLFNKSIIFGQKKYPVNDFRNPLDIPIVLAGTFGELRSNHFHSGIDIKTQQRTGLKVHTAKEGYVSRIKISLYGYGKAIYVTHPNGYTTVYAHLKKFSPKIEAYVKQQQYLKKTYTIQLFPNKNTFKLAKDEVIAYSGNSGSSGGPHLHFEIRNTKTEKIINPLLFGYKVKDHINPKILGLKATPIGGNATVNLIKSDQIIHFNKINDSTYVADEIEAFGKIGLAVQTHDLQNNAPNKNGIYSVDMFVNDTLKYHHDLETFAFSETKYINLLIDYPFYATRNRRFQKTYIEPHNKLSIYNKYPNHGYLNIKHNKTYRVKIAIGDLKGNYSNLFLYINGNKNTQPIIKTNKITDYFIDRNKYTVFKKGLWEVRFAKQTFYENTYIDFKTDTNKTSIHKPILPLHKKYTLTYFTDQLNAKQKKYVYLARQNGKKFNYASTQKTEGKIYTNTKTLGDYCLKYDSIAPVIFKASFYQNQNISKHNKLSIHIADKHTGIKKYVAKIDDKWVLMEYEPKKQKLTFDLKDFKANNQKHKFTLEVTDMLGNRKNYISYFIK